MNDKQQKRPKFLFLRIKWENFRAWQAAMLLKWSVGIRPEVYQGFIMERANELALKGVLSFLEREGLLHCVKCPSRGPLMQLMGQYWCKKHVPIIEPSRNGEVAHAAA